jgi:hypothetical protein
MAAGVQGPRMAMLMAHIRKVNQLDQNCAVCLTCRFAVLALAEKAMQLQAKTVCLK